MDFHFYFHFSRANSCLCVFMCACVRSAAIHNYCEGGGGRGGLIIRELNSINELFQTTHSTPGRNLTIHACDSVGGWVYVEMALCACSK